MSLNIINASGGGGGLTAEELATMIIPGVGIEVTYENDEFLFDRLETLNETTPEDGFIYIDCDKDVGEHHEVTGIEEDDNTLVVVNVKEGEKFRIKINSNGYAFNWFENITWVNGYAPGITPVTTGEGDTFEFLCTESTAYYQSFLGWILSTERPVFNTIEVISSEGTSNSINVETIQNGYVGDDEVQHIVFSSTPSAGTWTLTYDGQTTSSLAYDISAASLKSALEALSNIGVNDVSVVKNGTGDYTVTFENALAKTNVAEMTADGSSLVGAVCTVTSTTITPGHAAGACTITITTVTQGDPGTDEIQTFHLYGSPVGGTFTITYDGQTTSNIAYDASNATIQSALEALSNIAPGDVTVSGSSLPSNTKTLTFGGTLRGTNLNQITINTDFYNTSPAVNVTTTTQGVTATDEVQTISISGTPTGGTFTLTYSGQTTSGIAYDASNATIQSALEALSNLAPGDVTVTGSSFPTNTKTITFGGTLAATNVSQITMNGSSLTGGTLPSTASIVETTTGRSGLTSDLSVYWRLDETGARVDEIASQSLNTYGVYPSSVTGLNSNNATRITTSIYLECAHSSYIEFRDNFSIAFWVKINTTPSGGNWQPILYKGSEYKILNSSSYLLFSVGGCSVSTTNLSEGAWHLVVAVRDRDNETMKLSVDGGTFVEAVSNIDPLYLFSDLFLGSASSITHSYDIDELAMFTKALSQDEVDALYENGGEYPLPSAQNEVQTLSISGQPTTGNVLVTFDGQTATIPYNSSAATADGLFEALSSIGTGNVSVTGGPLPGTALAIEFTNSLGNLNVPIMTLDYSSLTNGSSSVSSATTTPGTAAVNEIESITYDVSPDAGTFTLTYGGDTTSALDWDATANEVQTALRALTSVGGANVNCSGGPFNTTPITIEFVNTLGGQNITQITSSSSLLKDTPAIIITEQVKGVPDLTSACSAHWNFNEGGISQIRVDDINANNLILGSSTGVSVTTGFMSNAIVSVAFPTSHGSLIHRSSPFATVYGKNITVTFWIKVTNSGTGPFEIVDGFIAGGWSWGIRAWNNPEATFFLQINHLATSSGDFVETTNFGTATRGSWYFIAASYAYATKQLKISVNAGTPNTVTGTATPRSGSSTISNDYFRVLGSSGSSTAWALDELSIWNKVLSQGEIEKLYNAGSGLTTPFPSSANEVQRITGNSTYLTQGTFNLTYDGQTTTDLAYNATSTDISNALKALSNIGNSDVSCSGGPIGTAYVDVTFQTNLAKTDVSMITADWEDTTWTASTTTQGVLGINEVETININPIPTSGSFTLTYSGQTTASLAYNASASDIQTELIALSNIGSSDVSCTGGPINSATVTVTFQNTLGKTNVSQLTATPSSLTGSGGTNEVDQISISPSPVTGTFTLTFGGQTTSNLDYDATAAEVRDAFQLLSSVGWGNVVCSGGPINTTPINIEFQNALSFTDVGDITPSATALTGAVPSITVDTTQEGGGQLNEIQTLLSDAVYVNGTTFTITFDGQTTTELGVEDDAATIEAALIALSNIGAGDVNVTGGPLNITDIVVEFIDDMAAANQVEMTATATFLPPTDTNVDFSTGEFADVQLLEGSGAYTINLINLIPGKRMLVKVMSNSATGTLAWSSNVLWGDTGSPAIPDVDTYSLFEFIATNTDYCVGKLIESGLT